MNYQQKISFAIIICVICFFSGLFAYDAGKNVGRAELMEQIRRTPETCVPGQIFTHDKEVFLCAQTGFVLKGEIK